MSILHRTARASEPEAAGDVPSAVAPGDPVASASTPRDAPVEGEAAAEAGAPDEAGTPVGARQTFIGPRHAPRFRLESAFMRLVATAGIVGIVVAIAAILGTQNVAAWIIGLVASTVSVVLASILWSSRTL